MHCHVCKSICIKKGFQKNGTQKYYCKVCKRNQQLLYQRKAYNPITDHFIRKLVRNGSGISDIKNVLEISANTVSRHIRQIAMEIKAPAIPMGKEYEMDEMRTYIGNKKKLYWIAYAIERESRSVMSYFIGKRTNRTLKSVLKSLLHSEAKRIFTDGLRNYQYIIPKLVHLWRKHEALALSDCCLCLR